MGKVTIFCQLSGCTPEAESMMYFNTEYQNTYGLQLTAAFELLKSRDEAEGMQGLTIIGPLADNERDWIEVESIEEALALPEGRVRAVSGCAMDGMFDMGFCGGPEGGPDGALISFGSCFYVITLMLPILEAATGGRVSIRRLWDLTIMKGHIDAHSYNCLPGVSYGPIAEYWEQFAWMFGDISSEELIDMDSRGTSEEIADMIRSRGYWMWMRPDRFPIDSSATPQSSQNISFDEPKQTVSPKSIFGLPLEILHSLVAYLPLSDVISLALSSKTLYNLLLSKMATRDTIAKSYVRLQAPWYLPYGEAELKWWNDRNGDKVLGWEYLKRCFVTSHSMRNRRRIWKAAESIEQECEKEERAWAGRT
ncbi:F-box protein [Ceratobasidium sp. AG-Ba]|nr:F-box protein [Ceratobasidium sp. AG-Ba]QRV91713.1 F-box protein [Ceratobasidium sp. AG-Ba]